MTEFFSVSVTDEDDSTWRVSKDKKQFIIYKKDAPRGTKIGDILDVRIKKIVNRNFLYRKVSSKVTYVTTKVETLPKIDYSTREYFDMTLLYFNHSGWTGVDKEHNRIFMPATHSFSPEFNENMVGQNLNVKLLKIKQNSIVASYKNTLSRLPTEITISINHVDDEHIYFKGTDLKIYKVRFNKRIKHLIDFSYTCQTQRYSKSETSFYIENNLVLVDLFKNKVSDIISDKEVVSCVITNILKDVVLLYVENYGFVIQLNKPDCYLDRDTKFKCQYNKDRNEWTILQ